MMSIVFYLHEGSYGKNIECSPICAIAEVDRSKAICSKYVRWRDPMFKGTMVSRAVGSVKQAFYVQVYSKN